MTQLVLSLNAIIKGIHCFIFMTLVYEINLFIEILKIFFLQEISVLVEKRKIEAKSSKT